jgi:hypothetical protein
MAELAPRICGRRLTLRIVSDATVPPPVVEEPPPPAPLPEPAPRPEKKPQPKAPEKKPAQPEKPAAPASLRPTEEEFYQDPLIELALKEFHATLIK